MENELRKKIIQASYEAKACHIPSALSCCDIVEAVYGVKKPEDIFIFAKATGVCALYCYLHPEKAAEYIKKYPLPSKEVEGIIFSAGSLGQGLSVACGLALADRTRKVYCLISDAECQEGQVWEAIMFAAHHKLSNLICIVDRNFYQALGKTEEIMELEPLMNKFVSFGWHSVYCVDGNDIKMVKESLKEPDRITNGIEWFPNMEKRPKIITAETTKGKGISFMENDNSWHYRNLSETQMKQALKELE